MSLHLLLCALGRHWWIVDAQRNAQCPICKATGRYFEAQMGYAAFVAKGPHR